LLALHHAAPHPLHLNLPSTLSPNMQGVDGCLSIVAASCLLPFLGFELRTTSFSGGQALRVLRALCTCVPFLNTW